MALSAPRRGESLSGWPLRASHAKAGTDRIELYEHTPKRASNGDDRTRRHAADVAEVREVPFDPWKEWTRHATDARARSSCTGLAPGTRSGALPASDPIPSRPSSERNKADPFQRTALTFQKNSNETPDVTILGNREARGLSKTGHADKVNRCGRCRGQTRTVKSAGADVPRVARQHFVVAPARRTAGPPPRYLPNL